MRLSDDLVVALRRAPPAATAGSSLLLRGARSHAVHCTVCAAAAALAPAVCCAPALARRLACFVGRAGAGAAAVQLGPLAQQAARQCSAAAAAAAAVRASVFCDAQVSCCAAAPIGCVAPGDTCCQRVCYWPRVMCWACFATCAGVNSTGRVAAMRTATAGSSQLPCAPELAVRRVCNASNEHPMRRPVRALCLASCGAAGNNASSPSLELNDAPACMRSWRRACIVCWLAAPATSGVASALRALGPA